MELAIILRSAVILFFTLWLLLTFFTQIKGRVRSTIKSYDVLGLLPIWSFFAPRPSTADLCLMFRDIYPSGEMSPWRIVETNPPRKPFHLLWNPLRRTQAALVNLSRHLPTAAGPADLKNFKESVAYRAVVNVVMHLLMPPLACARQFCFMAVWRTPEGEQRSRPVFLSDRICSSADEKCKEDTSPAFRITVERSEQQGTGLVTQKPCHVLFRTHVGSPAS
jgi:hypothetical protein